MNRTTKRLVAVGAPIALIVGAGIAFAAWTSTGSGSGTAQSTTAKDSVVAAGTSAADLYPGGQDTFTITVSNPNPYPIIVTSIPAASSEAIGSCLAGSVTSDAVSTNPAGITQSNGSTVKIPGRVGTTDGTGTYTVTGHMIADPDNSCQGQSFTLDWNSTIGNVLQVQSAAS